MTLRELVRKELREILKMSPTSSQVHVPATGKEDKVHKEKHDMSNLERLKEAFALFLDEEEKEAAKKALPPPAEEESDEDQEQESHSEEYVDPDASANMYPGINNDESELIEMAYEEPGEAEDSNMEYLHNMQRLVEGIDYETGVNMNTDQESAKDLAIENLQTDPNYYRKLQAHNDSTDDVLAKDTSQNDLSDNENDRGLNIDLGSGMDRAPGHIGYDTYPYDYGTIIHDFDLGIPLPDSCVKCVQMSDSLHHSDNSKALLAEVQRVLKPGGKLMYQGPHALDEQDWMNELPGLVLTNHEDNTEGDVQKAAGDPSVVRQEFTRIAHPDPATANDAEPRIGIDQGDMLPADVVLGVEALGYYWSDATSSGKGNRLHGYPSQGALTEKRGSAPRSRSSAAGGVRGKSLEKAKKNRSITPQSKSQAIEKALRRKSHVVKADMEKQLVYGVILEPDSLDSQNDFMTAEDIEKTAHEYMAQSRVIGGQHEKPVSAVPVESYIAPQDMEFDGQYGPQTVKKGSWVLGVKILDPEEWEKVKSGHYTGFSVGGLGERDHA